MNVIFFLKILFEEFMLFSFRPEKVSTKYLGIDKHLTWQYHITYLIIQSLDVCVLYACVSICVSIM